MKKIFILLMASLVCLACSKKTAEEYYTMAEDYRNGTNGQAIDKEEAAKLYLKAAEMGHLEAQYRIGNCYYYAEGIEQNYEEAVKWYRLAAEQGHSWAQNNLGVRYHKGEGVAQSYEEAMKWYQLAAEQGNEAAYCNIGLLYEYGLGVVKDEKEAFKWYTLSAEKGDDIGQYKVGDCYYYGNGICFALDFCCNRNERYRKAKKGSRTERSCAWLYYV